MCAPGRIPVHVEGVLCVWHVDEPHGDVHKGPQSTVLLPSLQRLCSELLCVAGSREAAGDSCVLWWPAQQSELAERGWHGAAERVWLPFAEERTRSRAFG